MPSPGIPGALQGGQHAGIRLTADVVGSSAAGVGYDALLCSRSLHGGIEQDFRGGRTADVAQTNEQNPERTAFSSSFRLTAAAISAIKIHNEHQTSTDS